MNVDTIQVTRHALDRYVERRGGTWESADEAIRDMLDRVAHKNPPVQLRSGLSPSRTYMVGEWQFVVSADKLAVITCYPRRTTGQGKGKRRRKRRTQ